MTNFAQLHDCHSCNDERSIVQKKKCWRDVRVVEMCWRRKKGCGAEKCWKRVL